MRGPEIRGAGLQRHHLRAMNMTAMTKPAASTIPSGVDEPSAALSARVTQAKTDALFERATIINLAGVAFAFLICQGLRPYAHAPLLWAWFSLRCAMAILRIGLSLFYARSKQQHQPFWRRAFMVSVILDSLAWSSIGWWLIPKDIPNISVLVLAALLGIVSMTCAIFQHSWRATAAFTLCTLLPIALQQLMHGDRSGRYVGSALLVYLALSILEARASERRIRELLYLRFNTDQIAEERAQALYLAQRQSRVKSQFLATMSHEMRTPLHGILGMTRALRQEPSAAPQLALIEGAGNHLLTLINDALDFSKLETGQVRLQSEAFDLAAVIDDVLSLSMPTAYEAGLNLVQRLHMPKPCVVLGDAARVRQILHNLVGNAIKFTHTGSVTVVAKYSTARGRARIAIHDTGIGIAPEDLPLIFEAFHQADNSFTRRYPGTGLGLAIARDLARAMGGDLVATSQPQQGSCFTVTLDLPQAQVDLPLEIHSAPLQKLFGHVLLAEDNPVNALVAQAVLKKLGLSVQLVENGEQALAAFCAQRPNWVLLDCQMPVMDGLEAARRIRAHEHAHGWPPTPLIALTANALQGDREQSLAAGMNDHLAKPFHDADLARILGQFLPKTPISLK
jgi:two-component system, sensor histidine kinase